MSAGKVSNVLCRTNAILDELSWGIGKGQVTVKIISGKAQNIKLMLRGRNGNMPDKSSGTNEKMVDNAKVAVSFQAGQTKEFTIDFTEL